MRSREKRRNETGGETREENREKPDVWLEGEHRAFALLLSPLAQCHQLSHCAPRSIACCNTFNGPPHRPTGAACRVMYDAVFPALVCMK